MNPMSFLQLKPAWEQFQANHPKLQPFLKAASREGVMDEGTLVEMTITTREGKKISSNIRVQPSDLEFLRAFRDLLES